MNSQILLEKNPVDFSSLSDFLLQSIDSHLSKVLRVELLKDENSHDSKLAHHCRILLHTMCSHSVLAPCKRLRPILLLMASLDIQGWSYVEERKKEEFLNKTLRFLDLACALELIHSYSLIHDDLPSMDDDELRRGRPTLHTIYPESHAILTGDFLLTFAFQILSQSSHLDALEKVQVIANLSKNSGGSQGMLLGQIMDLEGEGQDLLLQDLKNIHLNKTAALISSSLECAAIVNHISKEDRKNLKEFAFALGLAFQVQDDILDLCGTAKELGKPPASDLKKNKSTYVSTLGLDQAKEYAQKCSKQAQAHLLELSFQAPLLQAMTSKLLQRKK